MTDTVELPFDALAEHVRQQIKLDSDIRIHAPEGVDIDKWDHINDADVDDIRWEDGDLHVWMESETTLSRQVARATRHQPAEYVNDPARVALTVVWDMDPESQPVVDIEVLPE
jgi:hypothetical protein